MTANEPFQSSKTHVFCYLVFDKNLILWYELQEDLVEAAKEEASSLSNIIAQATK